MFSNKVMLQHTILSWLFQIDLIYSGHRKREIRLLKNREAARECRRKKKEYIKCLENRVAVLENQNKALIEELKSLKELYTGWVNFSNIKNQICVDKQYISGGKMM